MTSVRDDTRVEGSRPSAVPDPQRPRAARIRAVLVPAVILLVPVWLVAWSFWPGMMSNDTLGQIHEADSGDFTNQHAPLLMFLWRPFFELGFGPGWVLTAQLLTFVLGCFLVLRVALRPVPAAAAAAAIALSPPIFGFLGYLSRDIWYTAFVVLCFGLTARAFQDPGRRKLWIGLALAAAWLTLAARQNAAPVIVIVLILIGGLLLAGRGYVGRRRIVTAIGAGVGLCIALMASQFALSAIVGVRNVYPEQFTMIYDVAAISHKERVNLFPPDVMPRRGIAVVDEHWNPEVMAAYTFSENPPIRTPLAKGPAESLREAWLDAIADHPLTYIEARLDIQRRQMGIGRAATWIYQPWIDPNDRGYAIRFPEANATAADYVEGFADDNLNGRSPFYILWLYLLVAIVAGVWLLFKGRQRPVLLVVGGLGLTALTLQSGLLLGAMALQYRYEYPMVVSAILCAIVAVAVWRRPAETV